MTSPAVPSATDMPMTTDSRRISFDSMCVAWNHEQPRVGYTYSLRDPFGVVLETFQWNIRMPLLAPERAKADATPALLSLGVCLICYPYVHFPTIRILEIRAVQLDEAQLQFFEALFYGGLAEYFYLLKMNLRGWFSVRSVREPGRDAPSLVPLPARQGLALDGVVRRVLVPMGCGKDSCVCFERLRSLGCDAVEYVYYCEHLGQFHSNSRYSGILKAAGVTGCFLVEQDKVSEAKLQQMSSATSIVPSDYVVYQCFILFASAAIALQHGYNFIVMGNEQSANEINLVDPTFGYEVNHQYEKSFFAEQQFHRFLKENVAADLYYFSGLQAMNEYEIAREFARYRQYLPVFMSCNYVDDWCGKCEKCAFVFALLSAFLEASEVCSVFNGKDLLDDASMEKTFWLLAGEGGHKPLECVGTPTETIAALFQARGRRRESGMPDSAVLRTMESFLSARGPEALLAIDCKSNSRSDPTLYPCWYHPVP